MLHLTFALLITSCFHLSGALDNGALIEDLGNGRRSTRQELKDYYEKIYGSEIRPYVDIYANNYRNLSLFEQIIQKADSHRLLKLSAITMELNNRSLFNTIIQRIHTLDPAVINTHFGSGITLLLSFVGGDRPPIILALLDDLMNLYGDALDVNVGSIAGETPEQKDPQNVGVTPLFQVAQRGDGKLCKKLLSSFKNIELDSPRSDGSTPLIIAAECRHPRIIEQLYQHAKKYNKSLNVDNQTNATGTTPLITSIGGIYNSLFRKREYASDDVARMLVGTCNADVNLPHAPSGATPLFWGARHGRFELAQFFISHGANISHTLKDGSNVLHAITNQISAENIPTQSSEHYTTLPTYGLESFLKTVLNGNHHLWTMQSDIGNTPLHNAVFGDATLMAMLLRTAKNLQIPDYQNVTTKTGRTALHCAASAGNATMIRLLLLEHNADPYKIDNNGYTPLDLAKSCKQKAFSDILAEKEEATQQKKLRQRTKKQKNKRLALTTKHHEACSSCGSYVSCACTSSADTTSSISSITLAPKKAKALTKINATELLNYKFLSAPEGVCAMRNKSNIVIGYKQNPAGECHPIDPSCYLCNNKEKDTGDKYHFLDRDFDPSIIGYGTQIPYNERAKHAALLEKYSITIHPGHTVYVMPGRIEAPWYDPMLALEHRDVVSSFGGSHNGAFVIAMDHNRKIRHKQFHPTAEQKAVHSYWKNNL